MYVYIQNKYVSTFIYNLKGNENFIMIIVYKDLIRSNKYIRNLRKYPLNRYFMIIIYNNDCSEKQFRSDFALIKMV